MLLILLCLAVAFFIAYLYALLLHASLVVAFGANHTWTLAHYHVIFTEGRKAIVDTMIIALIGMPLGGFYGVLLGYLVARKEFAGRAAMEVVSMINYALPGTIVGHRVSDRLQRSADRADRHGADHHRVLCVPLLADRHPHHGRAAAPDRQSLEEASSSLGARSVTTFRRITLPLVMPAFFAGVGVVFIRSMTAISATIFLVSIGWTLITVRILENMTELSLGPAAAFSVFVIVVVMLVTTARQCAAAPPAGRGRRAGAMEPRGRMRWTASASNRFRRTSAIR